MAVCMAALSFNQITAAEANVPVETTQKKTTKSTTGKSSTSTQSTKGKYKEYTDELKKTVPYPYFESSEAVSEWNPKEITLKFSAQIAWPISIPGVSDLAPIHQFILADVLGQPNATDISSAVTKWVKTCKMDEDFLGGFYDPEESLIFQPQVENARYVVFNCTEIIYNGSGTAAGYLVVENFVIFDKKSGKWFDGNILKNPDSRALLNIVNTYVKASEDTFGDGVLAERVPEAMYPEANKLVLVYPKYEIGPGAAGNVRIKVPYTKILNYLTPEFRKLIGK